MCERITSLLSFVHVRRVVLAVKMELFRSFLACVHFLDFVYINGQRCGSKRFCNITVAHDLYLSIALVCTPTPTELHRLRW